jgi:predicted HicB family RNase H-like nuclease
VPIHKLKKDAKAVAALQCKSQKLIKKAAESKSDILEESQEISLEAAALFSKMQGKIFIRA